ncbi:MAG: hypothetical protein QOH91_454 [Mycobacterium sp.]|nr:hypothetical protein [Mycobacterium sp.]
MLATGCTDVIRGAARAAPNLKPRPLRGETIKQVLLDGAALLKFLNQPFKADSDLPPVYGGSEKLLDRHGSASPADCTGVVYMAEKSAYQSADVKNIARESWWHDGASMKVMAVEESVVSLSTAAAADALFDRFSAQWNECDGKTLTVPSGPFVSNAITQVHVANSVLAATVSRAGRALSSGTPPGSPSHWHPGELPDRGRRHLLR